jgi:beta-lactamase class A
MRQKRLFLFILLSLGAGFILYLGQRYYTEFQEDKKQQLLYEKRKASWQDLKQKLTTERCQFKGEVGIVVKDLQTFQGLYYGKDDPFPSASLVKIPIMAVCFLAAEEGKIKLDRKVALKSSDKFSGSGILKDTRIGTTFTVEELIGLMIYDSDNTATNMLTNMVGIDYLNNAFNSFGLKNTKLSRKVADFSLRDRGIENYTTAEDMTLILEKMYRRVLVSENVSDKCLKLLKLQRINDRIPKYLPVDVTVAHKTGLESSVCHDAGIVFTCKGNFLIVVLTKHANSDSAPSKEFIAKVAMYVYKYFEQL